jgi:hypothetical protein
MKLLFEKYFDFEKPLGLCHNLSYKLNKRQNCWANFTCEMGWKKWHNENLKSVVALIELCLFILKIINYPNNRSTKAMALFVNVQLKTFRTKFREFRRIKFFLNTTFLLV